LTEPVDTFRVAIDDATRLVYLEVLDDEKSRHRSRSCAAPSPTSPLSEFGLSGQ
jgi:hypothetical protein